MHEHTRETRTCVVQLENVVLAGHTIVEKVQAQDVQATEQLGAVVGPALELRRDLNVVDDARVAGVALPVGRRAMEDTVVVADLLHAAVPVPIDERLACDVVAVQRTERAKVLELRLRFKACLAVACRASQRASESASGLPCNNERKQCSHTCMSVSDLHDDRKVGRH